MDMYIVDCTTNWISFWAVLSRIYAPRSPIYVLLSISMTSRASYYVFPFGLQSVICTDCNTLKTGRVGGWEVVDTKIQDMFLSKYGTVYIAIIKPHLRVGAEERPQPWKKRRTPIHSYRHTNWNEPELEAASGETEAYVASRYVHGATKRVHMYHSIHWNTGISNGVGKTMRDTNWMQSLPTSQHSQNLGTLLSAAQPEKLCA